MPMSFPSAVNPPGGASYMAPLLNFAELGDWGSSFQQGTLNKQQQGLNDQSSQLNSQTIQQRQQQLDLAKTFQGGLPRDAQGNIDYQAVVAALAQKGDIGSITQMAPLLQQQQAGATPMLPPAGGQGGGAAAPVPSSVAAPPLRPVSANSPQGDAAGSVISRVTDLLPDVDKVGVVASNVAKILKVDPNAPLTPEQAKKADDMLLGYAERNNLTPRNGGATSFDSRFAASGDQRGSLPPSANAVSPAPKAAPAPQQAAPIGAGSPQPQAGAPPQPQAQGQSQGPITPQVPLPPGFTDPQQAAQALRQRAAQIESANPRTKPKADELRAWADRIDASIAPLKVHPTDTIIDPRNSRTLYQGPAAAAYATPEAAVTLDADAQRYRQTGTLPPNMGRGIQGQQQATAIRTRAAEQEINAGGDPAKWPERWQDFRAQGTGKSTAERVRANREENLNIILRATAAAIPAALEASKELPRSDFVPLNKLIQHGEVMTSNPKLLQFGMANLQLAEHWARAMNPTGVMRESDRDKALSFLNTAYGNNTYEAGVHQLEKQIQREQVAVRGGNPTKEIPAPGQLSPEQKATDKASAPDKDGWTTLPNGARIREKKAGE